MPNLPPSLEQWRQEQQKSKGLHQPTGVDPARLDPTNLLYGTSGPVSAEVMIVGESWGENEAKQKQPFVGNTGAVLDDILLSIGIERERCFITNVVPAQPANNDMWRFFFNKYQVRAGKYDKEVRGLYPKKIVMEGLARLEEQIKLVKPKLIIGLGNYTLWALTSDKFSITDDKDTKSTLAPGGIGNWRGSQLYTQELVPGIPFLPTFHPASTFHQYSNRFLIAHDLSMRVPKALHGRWDPPPWRFRVRPSYHEVHATLDNLLELAAIGPLELAVDIETRFHHISCVGVAWNTLDAICIPFMTSEDPAGSVAYWSIEEETEIVWKMRRLFAHESVRLIGQNFLYDAQYFAYYWAIKLDIYLDTMITHHLLWPGTPRGLDHLSSLYCQHHLYWKEDGKDWLNQFGDETNWIYNCTDCVRTFEVAQVLKRDVKRYGMEYPFQLQHERWGLAFRMMLRGVAVDTQRRLEVGFELAEAINEREIAIDGLVPEDLWPRERKRNGQLKKAPWFRSPAQQKQIIYDVLGVKPVYDRKSKSRTLNAEAMAIVKRREPILNCILNPIEEMRSLAKFNEFVVMKLDPDNRMRCYFDPSGTETFRYSSRENAFGNGGNLENISKGREDE